MSIGKRNKNKTLASKCRHYVDYQSKSEASDGEGGFTEVWANIEGATQIPTEIIPIIKSSVTAEMRSWNVIATHYLKIRSNIPVDEVGRAVFVTPTKTRYFYIKKIDDIETMDIEQFMLAEERRS